MLAFLNYAAGNTQPIVARTGVGSINRAPQLPIELSGLTMTINGAACGLKFVSRTQILFVVPQGLASAVAGTRYPLVINNNGTYFRGEVTIVPSRPDIFTTMEVPGPGGRADIKNVTNRVHTTEPFGVFTVQLRGGRRIPSIFRIRVTGVNRLEPGMLNLRIGSLIIIGGQLLTGGVPVEPGIQTIDFTVPAGLEGAGDVPVILEAFLGGQVFQSRLDDTAPRTSFY
jgi:hypothetical protein